MYNPQLSQAIATSISRLRTELAQAAPFMASPTLDWINGLAGTAQPEDYFKHPVAFPSLLLPWWLEESLGSSPDLAFQSNLVYSTINGYYYIRLIDNLMDDQATVELDLLPVTGFFHTQFQRIYHQYFDHDHPFWTYFTTFWFESAEAAMQDAILTDVDEGRFRQVAAKKVCAGKIPLAAVGCRYDRFDWLDLWFRFFDRLGAWHQMYNDLFDWHTDLQHQNRTYFLCEGERRKRPEESIETWVIREGFEWGSGILQNWLTELQEMATDLQNPNLTAYLKQREELFLKQTADGVAGLRTLAKVLKAL